MKTIEEEFTKYWLMPAEELRQRIDILTRIADLRLQLCATTEPPKQPMHPARELRPAPRGLAKRLPMRAPKAGSLRANIQAVLHSHGKPMTRADIIEAVAKIRGTPLTAKFRAKVGDTLTNPHDPLFTRTAHGVYALGKEV